jgi:hypothetical protein
MPPINYSLVRQVFQSQEPVEWFVRDAADDFFPDPIGLCELENRESDFLANRTHRMLQLDALPHIMEHVPKKSGLLREAVILHPVHRVVYLAIMKRFLARIDRELLTQNYSYESMRAKVSRSIRLVNAWSVGNHLALLTSSGRDRP